MKLRSKLNRYIALAICIIVLFTTTNTSASSQTDKPSLYRNELPIQQSNAEIIRVHNNISKLKNVLVLHSYHEGFRWTDQIMQGINSTLEYEKVELFINYMDTKRCADDDYFHQLRDIYKNKYADVQFDAILSTDDHALNFLLNFDDSLFPDVPVVFCGINDFQSKQIKGHNQYTGIYETYDVLGTVNLMRQFHSGLKTIAVINDASVSGNAFLNRVKRAEHQLKDSIKFEYLSNLTLAELHAGLTKLPIDAAVIWGIYLRTPEGIVLTSEESIQLINSYTQLPVYCIWDVVGQGVVGGKITSPVFQGEEAAKFVIRILNGEKPEHIPVTGSPMVYKFDYNTLQQFNISKSALPAHSIVINEPFSIFKQYRKFIWTIFIIITVLIIIVLTLMHLLQKINTTKKVLQITNRKLEIAKVKAEESDRLKTSFLANLSHEIRTPMNGIIGFAELLDHKDVAIAKQHKYLALIKSSSQRMLELINNLVDISKIETGQIKCLQNVVNLNKLMDDVYAFFIPLAENKNLKISYKEELEESSYLILTDRQRLEQVLYNLLTNAIKFTKEGEIVLSLEKRNNLLYFSVKDSGPGIPYEMKDIIFERFRQADHTSFHPEEGSGLGLAISKSLVEMMGGEIGVRSELNKGAEFYFTLPCIQAK